MIAIGFTGPGMKYVRLGLALVGILFFTDMAVGQTIKTYSGSPVEFLGTIEQRADLSAIGQIHSFLVIGSDEAVGKKHRKKNIVQLLQGDGENRYVVHSQIALCIPEDADGNCKKKHQRKEMDIEGIAVDGSTVYVIGSHSTTRKKIRCEPTDSCTLDCKKSLSYAENRAILDEPFSASKSQSRSGRDRLVRFHLDASGAASKMEEISLGNIIDDLPLFRPFSKIPGKENGVNIEGIAVRGGILHVGFRSPVLRGNYVPVLKLRFDALVVSKKDIVYVKLGGRGIRDLVRVSDGFLILAGPVGNDGATYQLYHWDGGDMVPGDGPRANPPGALKLLGVIAPPPCGRPEGIVVQQEDATSYKVIIVFDGAADDVAHRFTIISKP